MKGKEQKTSSWSGVTFNFGHPGEECNNLQHRLQFLCGRHPCFPLGESRLRPQHGGWLALLSKPFFLGAGRLSSSRRPATWGSEDAQDPASTSGSSQSANCRVPDTCPRAPGGLVCISPICGCSSETRWPWDGNHSSGPPSVRWGTEPTHVQLCFFMHKPEQPAGSPGSVRSRPALRSRCRRCAFVRSTSLRFSEGLVHHRHPNGLVP